MRARLLRVIGICVILAVTFGIFVTPCYATDEPDSVSLYDITIFEDLITTGDMLVVAPYSIPFTTLPDDALGELFLFRWLSADGLTELGASVPFAYQDLGYGAGVVTFYLESGGVWNTAYIFRVQENPAYYTTPLYWDFVVGPANYSSASDQSAALRLTILGIANTLTTEYGVELLSTSESGVVNLSTYGEIYFMNAIPGLSTMCPTLFSVQVRSPDYTKRTWSYTLANTLKTRYSGTFIEDFMTGYAGLTNTDVRTSMNVMSIILFTILVLVSVKVFKANTYAAVTDGYALLLVLMINSFIDMVLVGFIAFILVATGGVVLFLNRS